KQRRIERRDRVGCEVRGIFMPERAQRVSGHRRERDRVRVQAWALGEKPAALGMTREVPRQLAKERVLHAHLKDRTVQRIRRVRDQLSERTHSDDKPADHASRNRHRIPLVYPTRLSATSTHGAIFWRRRSTKKNHANSRAESSGGTVRR